MSEYQELTCFTCNEGLKVFFKGGGAPFSYMYLCESCKDLDDDDNEEENHE